MSQLKKPTEYNERGFALNEYIQKLKNEIIIYQANELSTRLEVRIEEETVWLTQAQMAELFQTTRNNVTLHISNIFQEKELNKISVCKDSLLTASDGKKWFAFSKIEFDAEELIENLKI